MSDTADKMFSYLRDVLYNPENANLDVNSLDDEYKTLGEGLQFFARCLHEVCSFSLSLSRGELDAQIPPRDNELASPLKSLHASLRHLTWQTQQVANGDYHQKVDFMGEFSDAFNTMTLQLEQRQTALEEEISIVRDQQLALLQHHALMEAITNELEQWITVVDSESREVLFRNRAAHDLSGTDPKLVAELNRLLITADMLRIDAALSRDLYLTENDINRVISANVHPINWRKRKAVAFVLTDISEKIYYEQNLKNIAYIDPMTQCRTRLYGMDKLQELISRRQPFSICFTDLDNLKYFNDAHGHAAGDKYIITAGDMLKKTFDTSVVCRLGGDEFMILAPDMPRAVCEDLLIRLRADMMSISLPYDTGDVYSISYGIVEYTGDEEVPASDLLTEADNRMYLFKRSHKKARVVPAETAASHDA